MTGSAELASRSDELEERLASLKEREREQARQHVEAIVAGDLAAEKAAQEALSATRSELEALAQAAEEIREQFHRLQEAEREEEAARHLRRLVKVRGGIAGEFERRREGLTEVLAKLRDEVAWLREQPARIAFLDAEKEALAAAYDLPLPDAGEAVEGLDLAAFAEELKALQVEWQTEPASARPDRLLARARDGQEGAFGRLLELVGPETATLLEGRFEHVRRED